jgi:hypothetical protein
MRDAVADANEDLFIRVLLLLQECNWIVHGQSLNLLFDQFIDADKGDTEYAETDNQRNENISRH